VDQRRVQKIAAAEELELASLRRDGTLSNAVTIWVVPRQRRSVRPVMELEQHHDLEQVRALLGHQRLDRTQIYTMTRPQQLKRAVAGFGYLERAGAGVFIQGIGRRVPLLGN
jgi:site-specific recombinase XerC